MGITVLPPDVNASAATFTPVGGDIRFGLAAVRNVGTNVVDAIVAARTTKGAFTSFADFLRKVPVNVCNKRVIESLVKAGAFDSLGHPRKGLVLIHEQAIDTVIDVKRNEAIGQDSLFGGDAETEATFEVPVPDGEWDKTTLLAFEREMLGLYVSDHPLLGVEHIVAANTDCSVAELLSSAADEPSAAAGRPGRRPDGHRRRDPVRGAAQGHPAGQPVGGGHAGGPGRRDRGAVLPGRLPAVPLLLAEDAILVVKGRLDRREDAPKLIAMEVSVPDLSVDQSGPFVVSIPVQRCVAPVVDRLREVLCSHPGLAEVHLRLCNGPRATIVRLDDKLRVKPSPALVADLKQLLGPACVG